MPVAIVGLATAAYGAYENRKAGKRATGAANKAEAASQGAQEQAREDYAPYTQLGTQATGQLNTLLGGDYSGFLSSPDYTAARDMGLDAIDRSATARGALNSSDPDRIKFGENLATQTLGNYRGWLGNLASMGQSAVGALSQVGQQTAANTGANATNAAGAANAVGANNVSLLSGALGSALSGYQSLGSNTRASSYNPTAPQNFGNNLQALYGYGR